MRQPICIVIGFVLLFTVIVMMNSCSGGNISYYTVGGSVAGLTTGEELVLQNNSTDDLAVTENSFFTFPISIADGGFYDVTVLSSPEGKTCSVSHNEGYISGVNITDVNVVCSSYAYTVGGTAQGLDSGDMLVLQLNLDDDLSITGDGDFTFPHRSRTGVFTM